MNRCLYLVAIWLGAASLGSAASLGLSDTAAVLCDQNGDSWANVQVEWGGFADDFVPTATNRAQWATHWVATAPGYQTASAVGREWSVELVANGNTGLPAGQMLYAWAHDGTAAALFTDPAWRMPGLSPLSLARTFRFSAQTTAVWGAFDGATLGGATTTTGVVIVTQPVSQVLSAGSSTTLGVIAGGPGPYTYQWQRAGLDLAGATNATLAIVNLTATNAGIYTVAVANPLGAIVSKPAVVALEGLPVIDTQPSSQTIAAGAALTLSASLSGAVAPSYQWFRSGVALAGATNTTYTVAAVRATDAGSYILRITNSAGVVFSNVAVVTVDFGSYLSNLSVRAAMVEGQTLIVGFVVENGAKAVLVRAAGPALNDFGLAGVADPRLTLFDSANAVVATNDDWPSSLAPQFAALGAFPFPTNSCDAALLQTIIGPHTTHAAGVGSGAVLVELYDAGANNGPRLSNVSARYHVGTGNDILIAGFVVAGSGPKHLLIRAIGPTLAGYGVAGTLVDPQFTVYSGGQALAANDDWSAALAPVFDSVGAFPLVAASKDAALVLTVDAGLGYTVQVSGADGGSGEALVEVYALP